jgi:hypothetical protein
MHLSASHKPNRLPKRFPVGTTYVVEGHRGVEGRLSVFSRYVVLPGGRRITLADDFGGDFAGPAAPRARRPSRGPNGTPSQGKNPSPRAKKIMAAGGTTRQRSR